MEDVTERILADLGAGRGDLSKLVARAAPAAKISDSLQKTLDTLQDPRFDTTMGFISAPLVYSSLFRGQPKSFHTNVIKLIKGKFLLVFQAHERPPEGTRAAKETPHASSYYLLALNSEMF